MVILLVICWRRRELNLLAHCLILSVFSEYGLGWYDYEYTENSNSIDFIVSMQANLRQILR